MVQAVCTLLWQRTRFTKRLKHEPSQVWRDLPPPRSHHHVHLPRWALCSPRLSSYTSLHKSSCPAGPQGCICILNSAVAKVLPVCLLGPAVAAAEMKLDGKQGLGAHQPCSSGWETWWRDGVKPTQFSGSPSTVGGGHQLTEPWTSSCVGAVERDFFIGPVKKKNHTQYTKKRKKNRLFLKCLWFSSDLVRPLCSLWRTPSYPACQLFF